jgi:ornithine cyclodeaminase
MIQSITSIDADTINRLLDYPSLIAAIREAFTDPPITPDRQAIAIDAGPGQPAGTLLVMPCLRPARLIGVKMVTIHPSLGKRKGGAVRSTYLVMEAASGELRGVVDGHALTLRRTAATSVLAASLLARPDAGKLLIVGTGQVARALAEAYSQIVQPDRICVWGRRVEAAERLAASLAAAGIRAQPVTNLAEAIRAADIITCATLSEEPLIHDEHVREGTHIDLVGGFTPNMREADDALVARARIVVDVERTISEAGDIAQPLRSGLIETGDITLLGEALSTGSSPRRGPEEVTLFKSSGHALEDMAAAELLFARLASASPENER